MAAADLTLFLTLQNQWFAARERMLHGVAKPRDGLRREYSGLRFEGEEGLFELVLQILDRMLSRSGRRATVRRGGNASKFRNDCEIELVSPG
jgi:hypothetical protein